jgi:hypothetical protein
MRMIQTTSAALSVVQLLSYDQSRIVLHLPYLLLHSFAQPSTVLACDWMHAEPYINSFHLLLRIIGILPLDEWGKFGCNINSKLVLILLMTARTCYPRLPEFIHIIMCLHTFVCCIISKAWEVDKSASVPGNRNHGNGASATFILAGSQA